MRTVLVLIALLVSSTEAAQPFGSGLADAGLLCDNSCAFANNGICEDGGDNSIVTSNTNRVCVYGSDCADCGTRFAIVPDLNLDELASKLQSNVGHVSQRVLCT